ncbi:MAG: ATP-binding protein [Gammaproteobacteria bacterium]
MSQANITLAWIYNLYRLGQKASSSDAKESAREEFLKYIITAFNANTGCIAHTNADNRSLTIIAGIGLPKEAIGSIVPFGSAVLGWVAENRKPLLLNGDLTSNNKLNIKINTSMNSSTPHRSSMCWPLLVENELVGVISINEDSEEFSFTEEDLKKGSNIIHFTALAVENARLLDQSQELLDQQKKLNKQLEEAHNQLLQSEKLASIGQLAAGVAHEINNPVGYINSNMASLKTYASDMISVIDLFSLYLEQSKSENMELTSTLKERIKEIDLEFIKSDLHSLIDESMEGVSRVKKIVHDLKDFSHVGDTEMQWADLHQGLDSTLNIVHNELKYKADIVKNYGDLPEVECIASQINQVFMNVLVNAAHAIENHGTITITTGSTDDSVFIKIQDTGKGIPEDQINRIFDPFFTSKPVGSGTGLGLSLSYTIIEKHNGKIEVESTVNVGTTFTVWLPISNSDVDYKNKA